ncbi:uncharacterized protein LOC120151691 [Hibiscus syriacus]|uniref:uncharacterized protein LOC120151691 n=1 Tax=Hibiscus syriacus TaxID=106335 RepID=UPI001924F4E8|nr:uncharacterized protein LOC120151691 [Hibiscus syriacus]
MRKIQEDMLNAQKEMFVKFASLLEGINLEYEKNLVPRTITDVPLYPLGFTPVQSQNVEETPIHTEKVHINPVGASVNLYTGSSSHPEEDQYPQVPDLDEEARKEQNKKLEEKWKKLSLVPDLVLPPKFKILDFEKFNGTRCPSSHITMFCRKMTGYIGDDQYCFQEILTGSAIQWYNQLSRANIRSWKYLAESFFKQYKHVKNVRPNRMMLQGMEKKSNESFRQYAQR